MTFHHTSLFAIPLNHMGAYLQPGFQHRTVHAPAIFLSSPAILAGILLLEQQMMTQLADRSLRNVGTKPFIHVEDLMILYSYHIQKLRLMIQKISEIAQNMAHPRIIPFF